MGLYGLFRKMTQAQNVVFLQLLRDNSSQNGLIVRHEVTFRHAFSSHFHRFFELLHDFKEGGYIVVTTLLKRNIDEGEGISGSIAVFVNKFELYD